MTINIVDTNNFAFHLAVKAVDSGIIQASNHENFKGIVDFDKLEGFINLNTIYMLSGAFLNQPGVQTAKYFFAGDSKPYWRYAELKKLGVIYKGKRGSGSSKYSPYLPLILTYLEKALAKQDTYVYMLEGYEADDIAAAMVNECAVLHSDSDIAVITSDHDWIPLLAANKRMTWYSTKEVSERKINNSNCMRFFKSHKTYNESSVRKQFPKNDITDMWRFKARFGDTSDNIPADTSGSMKYLPFIDLLNPPEEYDLKLQRGVIKDMSKFVSKEFKQVGFQTFTKRRLPFDLALNCIM